MGAKIVTPAIPIHSCMIWSLLYFSWSILPFGGSTGAPRPCLGAPGLPEQRNNGLGKYEPNNELNAATRVELAGADAEEHSKIGLDFSSLAFKLSNVADILEFRLGFAHIFTSLATESSKDVTGLFLSTNLDEPTR